MSKPDGLPQLSRRKMLRLAGASGLVALTASAATLGLASPAQAAQANWRWCSKCEGLWFNGHPGYGACPAGGGHISSGSGNYSLKFTADGGGGQDGWRWCHQCEGMRFHTPNRAGRCTNGGGHSTAGSGLYRLENSGSNDGAGGQSNWRWCSKCEGLWFNGHPGYGKCPTGGGHISSGSGDYRLRMV